MTMKQDAVRHDSRSEVIVYGGRLLRRASRGQRDIQHTKQWESINWRQVKVTSQSGAAVNWEEEEEELRFQHW